MPLKKECIEYLHIDKLSGLRHTSKGSVNLAWHNKSFREYADYLATPEFKTGLETLIEVANAKPTAIMCAEISPWRCHRSLIADALTKKGWLVCDILSQTKTSLHKLTPFLKVKKGQLIYPEPKR